VLQPTNCGIIKLCTSFIKTRYFCEIMVIFLSLFVNDCVLNQNNGHWLLANALQIIKLMFQNFYEKLLCHIGFDNLTTMIFKNHELHKFMD
jgi:hypothetical protein